ncbi:MAG: cupin-like domain-containing protein [Burkholderiales bacterium]|nr:cupin-like domain-containing protein [Burkholderiales bacterium]
MLKCFDESCDATLMDRQPFMFQHKLLGHPALSMDNLRRAIAALPSDHVKYSKGLLKNGDDFETASVQHRNGLSLEETIESIRTSDSYIMVRSPQVDESFGSVFRDLSADVLTLLRQQMGDRPGLLIAPRLYLFIASPNSHTPFHIDRNSTMLMQFRGSKEMVIFPALEPKVVTEADREAYAAYANTKLPWSPDKDAFAQRFDFRPGHGLHIPFMAGHYVRNGSEDVSISMSIIFNTPRSQAQLNALKFNHQLRSVMRPMGLGPSSVGQVDWRDSAKSNVWRAQMRIRRSLGLVDD